MSLVGWKQSMNRPGNCTASEVFGAGRRTHGEVTLFSQTE